MIELDIVYPHVGRSYRTSWETVAGCAVGDDPEWRVPVSLHYHYGLLDPGTVSRYVVRVAVSSRASRRARSRPTPSVVAPVSSARLVFAPADDTTSPERRAPTLDTPTPNAPPTPPVQRVPSSPSSVVPAADDGVAAAPPPPHNAPEVVVPAADDGAAAAPPPPHNAPEVVVLDEHYVVPMEAAGLGLPEDDAYPGWTLVDLSPRSKTSSVRSDSPRTPPESPREENEDNGRGAVNDDDEDVSDAIVLPSPAARVAVPTVSVVMTTYNCVKYLEHAVRSLQSQTLTNWELIVVDDRSTDGTDAQLRALAEEDDRIVYLHNRHNVGCYAAKNTAIAYARGEWLTFHDADDHSMSERLEKQLWYCVTGESNRRGRTQARGAHPPPSAADQGYDACYVTSLARKQKVWAWLPITLFLPLRLFREKLGAYDTVRFGADSELRKRLHSLRLRVGTLKDYLYACPDRWIELSTRTTSLTGDATKDPIRELYAKGYVGLHRPLQQAPALTEAEARLLRYPFPPFKRQDVCTRTHPFVIPGLTEAQAARLFPSTEAIRENLALNQSGEPPPAGSW